MNSFTNSGELPLRSTPQLLTLKEFRADRCRRAAHVIGAGLLGQPINLTRFNWYVLEQIRVSTALFEATYRRDAWALRTLLQEPFSFEYGIVAEAALFAAIAVAEVIAPSQSKVKVEDLLRVRPTRVDHQCARRHPRRRRVVSHHSLPMSKLANEFVQSRIH